MTEQEYMDTANLARLRDAISILGNMLPLAKGDKADLAAAVNALDRIRERLEKAVKVR